VYHLPGAAAGLLPGLACLCIALAACGGSGDGSPSGRTPVPAPRVSLSPTELDLWSPAARLRAGVPVLVHRGVTPGAFARQMALLDHAGYDTVTLEDLVSLVRGRAVALPPRPVLLTFDGGRLDSWTRTDAVLRQHGFGAVLFVDVGRIEEDDPAYLTWEELARLQVSGHWDVQLESGTGNRLIRYGPAPDDVGPFYAYRGSEEVLGGWRERVFSDVTYGEEQLAFHVPGHRPLAFAPPHGNYGQAGTNDRRIPRLLLARLELDFALVFARDRDVFASRGAENPLGRIEVARGTSETELHARLTEGGAP